jgi:ribose transport system ATP-binding protein
MPDLRNPKPRFHRRAGFGGAADLGANNAVGSTGAAALVLRDVHKSYEGVQALRGASLSCSFGQIHGLIGENGAGKSTLVKVLSGATTADRGVISIQGQELAARNPREAREQGIGTVFQELSLIGDLDVAQNMLYDREPRTRTGRINRRALRAGAAEALARYGLEQDVTQLVRDLRLAERQVLEIVKVLVREPRVLVLDEATSSLLPEQVDWLFEVARNFARNGGLVIFVSHRLGEIMTLCDRVTVLRDGRDVGQGPISDFSEARLVEMMLGRKLETVYPPRSKPPTTKLVCRLENFSAPPSLRQIDLDVHGGEIVGVAGLDGQGQTDLFLGLYGARRALGRVELDGNRVNLRTPAQALDAGVGLVPEDRARDGLCLSLDVGDNMTLSSLSEIARLGFIQRARARDRIDEGVDRMHIAIRSPSAEVSSLSGGNQQKVLLARVLLRGPRLLLMLDATRGVDVGTRYEIYRLMRAHCDSGGAILFYSSDISELVSMSDRVVVLHDGAVRALLEDDMSEASILSAVIGGSVGAAEEAAGRTENPTT